MSDNDKSGAEKLDDMRLNLQAERESTSKTRNSVHERRDDLWKQRADLSLTDAQTDEITEVYRLQDEIQALQHEILQLQAVSSADQDEINRLRRLADGYSNEIIGILEDSQTRAENIQTMQENLQHLREDLQRKQEDEQIRACHKSNRANQAE